jgi:hypothetical protein
VCYLSVIKYVDKDFLSITQAPGMLENDYKRSTRIPAICETIPLISRRYHQVMDSQRVVMQHWIRKLDITHEGRYLSSISRGCH